MTFGTREWLDALAAALNAQPDLPKALSGLGDDLAVVVERDPPAFPGELAAWGRAKGGRIVEVRLLDDAD